MITTTTTTTTTIGVTSSVENTICPRPGEVICKVVLVIAFIPFLSFIYFRSDFFY